MTISAFLPVLVLVIGLVLWLVVVGASKATVGEIGRWMFITGLLAFLLAAGNSMQSCSIISGGGSSTQHH